MGHVWTAPWQELSDVLQHWSGAVTCPASHDAAGVVAGPGRSGSFTRVPELTAIADIKLNERHSLRRCKYRIR
jgi:hypothetical protein